MQIVLASAPARAGDTLWMDYNDSDSVATQTTQKKTAVASEERPTYGLLSRLRHLRADKAVRESDSSKEACNQQVQPHGELTAGTKAAAGAVYGVTLGVPIRTGKYIASESHRMTQTLLDDFGGAGFWNMAMARAYAIPYGVASGTVLGLIRGVQRGSQYGSEEPFSKKSIGLGERCVVEEH